MKNILRLTALIALLFLAIVSAAAQATGTRFNIPFAFQVGKDHFPPAEYRVSIVNEKAILIARIDGTEAVVTMAAASINSSDRKNRPRLVFTSYGDKRFLSEAWLNSSSGHKLPKSAAEETEYARTIELKSFTVYAASK